MDCALEPADCSLQSDLETAERPVAEAVELTASAALIQPKKIGIAAEVAAVGMGSSA